MAKEGVISALLNILHHHPHDTELLTKACAALMNLAADGKHITNNKYEREEKTRQENKYIEI